MDKSNGQCSLEFPHEPDRIVWRELPEKEQQALLAKQKSPGLKNDLGKPSLGLIDGYFLNEVAKVLDHGAAKYGRYNWKAGIQWSRVVDAILRHVNAFNSGEDLDPETGLSHLAHASCGLMFLLNYTQHHKELDDRYRL